MDGNSNILEKSKKSKIKKVKNLKDKSKKNFAHKLSKNKRDSDKKDTQTVSNANDDEDNSETAEGLTLDDILFFGGEEDDLDMLREVDEDAELEVGDGDGEEESLCDLQSMLKKLIHKESNGTSSSNSKDDKPAKSKAEDASTKPKDKKETEKSAQEPTKSGGDSVEIVKNLTAALSAKKKTEPSISAPLPEFHEHNKLLLKNCNPWFEILNDVPTKTESQLDANALNEVHRYIYIIYIYIYIG